MMEAKPVACGPPGAWARPVSVLMLLVLALLAVPAKASAHATLIDTTPGNWQVVDTTPGQVSMRFNESVDSGLADVRVIGPDRGEVAGVSQPRHPQARQDVLAVTLPGSLPEGTYTVAYRVVSADSHPAQGAFAFSIGTVTGGLAAGAEAESAGANGAGSVSYGIARWLAFAGLALLIGTAFFAAVCWPGGSARVGVTRLLVAGWVTLVVATVASFVTYAWYTGGSLGSTLTSRMGLALGARLVLLAAIGIGLRYAFRRSPAVEYPRGRARAGAAVLGTGAVLAATWSLANHSVAGAQVALAVPVDTVHLLAMAVWLGGLPVLMAVLLRSGDVLGMRLAIPRFSRAALVSVGVLLVTGTYQAWRQVGSLSALFDTTYGGLLAGKVAVVGVLVGLGVLARNWVRRHYAIEPVTIIEKRRARRGPDRREISRFRRLVAVEAGLAAVVLGVTASLVSVEPARAELAREAQAAKLPERTGPVNVVLPFDAGGKAGKGQLAATLTPGALGRNEVHLSALDGTGMPRDVAEMKAELVLPDGTVGPIPVQLRFFGRGHYIGPEVVVPMPGQWELVVTVRTSEVDQDLLRIPVGVR